MNEKQVKNYAVVSIIVCYVLLMLPLILSKLHVWVLDEGIIKFVTTENMIEKIVGSLLLLLILILLIYSDNVIRWFDKTRIGNWINTPVRGYYKYKK